MRQIKYSVSQVHVLCNKVRCPIKQLAHTCSSLSLVTSVLAEASCVAFDIPCQIQLQMRALAFLTMHAQMVSLYSVRVTCPCFHPLYAPFLCLTFDRVPCSSMQTFWHFCFISCSLAWTVFKLGWSDLWISTSFVGSPRPPRVFSHRTLSSRCPKRPKSGLPRWSTVILLFALLSPPDANSQLICMMLSNTSMIVLHGQNLCHSTNHFATGIHHKLVLRLNIAF